MQKRSKARLNFSPQQNEPYVTADDPQWTGGELLHAAFTIGPRQAVHRRDQCHLGRGELKSSGDSVRRRTLTATMPSVLSFLCWYALGSFVSMLVCPRFFRFHVGMPSGLLFPCWCALWSFVSMLVCPRLFRFRVGVNSFYL